ncbi:MAG TPA: family 43 glycosylhydrolase [Clostridiales bacterium]|nr:family 43 glycosylhydrolase [Clostridiales bacterium]
MVSSFTPGRPMYDTQGKRIQAHAGGIYYLDGIYYWYGENKEFSTKGKNIWHWGVRCYQSTDLYNWEDVGLLIAPDEEDPSSPVHPTSLMDRPHILFNDKTGKYVCWLKIMGHNNIQTVTIYTADSFLGPYTLVKTGYRPYGMSAGDFYLSKDAVTGKAYYYFDKIHTSIISAELTDDYLSVSENYTVHYERDFPPYAREAPVHFIRKGKHYLVTSGITGYKPNPSEVAVGGGYLGPFTELGDLHPKDETRTSYGSQISEIFNVVGTDLYIAMGDRWLPDMKLVKDASKPYMDQYEKSLKNLARFISKERVQEMIRKEKKVKRKIKIDNCNTAMADYVWLPVRFDGDRPIIEWYDEWKLEDFI